MKTIRQGFTFIEIMVVVMIIGILAALSIPAFLKARTASQENICINNLRMLDGAMAQYAMEKELPSGTDLSMTDLVETDGYLEETPDCPSSGTYTIPSVDGEPTCTIPGHSL